MSKRYVAAAEPGGRSVTVFDGHGPRYALETTGARRVGGYAVERWFWGDDGQECKALALGILLDVSGDPEGAKRHHRQFWRQVVVKLLADRWTLDGERVLWWFRQAEALHRAAGALVAKAEEEAGAVPLEWPWSQD